jgi:hypothetical protein
LLVDLKGHAAANPTTPTLNGLQGGGFVRNSHLPALQAIPRKTRHSNSEIAAFGRLFAFPPVRRELAIRFVP